MADLVMLLCLCWVAFVFSPSCNCCLRELCDKCDNKTEDRNMQVVITGVVDQSCPQADCGAAFNGTHVVPVDAASSCRWAVEPISVCGNSDGRVAMFLVASGADLLLDVNLQTSAGSGVMQFRKTYSSTTSIDCSSFSSLSVPFNLDANPLCDSTSATCAVTSL